MALIDNDDGFSWAFWIISIKYNQDNEALVVVKA